MKTSELIAYLSQETPNPCLKTPFYYGIRLGVILIAYAMSVQFFLPFRTDLMAQLLRPMFAIEILLLGLLIIVSIVAVTISMYPDAYQKDSLLRIPYFVFGVLVLFIIFQLAMPHDVQMIIPEIGYDMRCALCVASVAIIPSAIIFTLLRKGASLHASHAGAFAVLIASSIGCLVLRLSETNDSLIHLMQWHYLPTVLFAVFGAIIGRLLLKW